MSAEQPVAKALHALFGSAGGLQATQPLAQQPAAMARKAASPAKPHEAFLVSTERGTDQECVFDLHAIMLIASSHASSVQRTRGLLLCCRSQRKADSRSM